MSGLFLAAAVLLAIMQTRVGEDAPKFSHRCMGSVGLAVVSFAASIALAAALRPWGALVAMPIIGAAAVVIFTEFCRVPAPRTFMERGVYIGCGAVLVLTCVAVF